MTAQARERVATRFRELHRRSPDLLVRAPGRVNLLGAHVDYNEGWVLPAAIDRGLWLAVGRAAHGEVRAESLEQGAAESIALPAPPPDADAGATLGWGRYLAGTAWALALAGREPASIDAVVGSDLGAGAGLGSSAALEVAFLVAWAALGGFELGPLEAAAIGRRCENEYIGVQSGIMDQFASLAGRRDHLVFLDCRTLEWELLALPPGLALLIADSGLRRRLADGALNDRRGECRQALQALRRRWPELEALRDLPPERLEQAAAELEPRLLRRVRHVVEECARTRAGAALLRAGGDAADLGTLVTASHRSSRDLYQSSLPELDLLAEVASSVPGGHGARFVGAGFGGCVVALVDRDAGREVAAAIRRGFGARFDRTPEVIQVAVADGAGVE